jgi:hypothetical protein
VERLVNRFLAGSSGNRVGESMSGVRGVWVKIEPAEMKVDRHSEACATCWSRLCGACGPHLPGLRIVYSKFHVMRHVNSALDNSALDETLSTRRGGQSSSAKAARSQSPPGQRLPPQRTTGPSLGLYL